MNTSNKNILAMLLSGLGIILTFLVFVGDYISEAEGNVQVSVFGLIVFCGFVSARLSYLIYRVSNSVSKVLPVAMMTIGIILGSVFLGVLVLYYSFRNFGFLPPDPIRANKRIVSILVACGAIFC